MSNSPLREQFPTLIGEHFNVWICQGWLKIVTEAMERLLQEQAKIPSLRVVQIKHKWGDLVIYYHISDEDCISNRSDAVDTIIEKARRTASETCEVCGMPGETIKRSRDGMPIKVRCAEHVTVRGELVPDESNEQARIALRELLLVPDEPDETAGNRLPDAGVNAGLKEVTHQAKVGIFFMVNRDLIFDAVPLAQGEPYGDTVGFSGHYDYWQGLVPQSPAEQLFKSHPYDYFPRGRVVYFKDSGGFKLYADRCMKIWQIEKVATAFQLPAAYELARDEHYQCAKCNLEYVDI